MQTKALFFIIFICFHLVIKADVGSPTLQAVCKVTLRNGKIVEGFIKLGSGDYEGMWVNGFNVDTYRKQQRLNKQYYFDLDFRRVYFTDSTIEYYTENCKYVKQYSNEDKRKITFLLWTRNHYADDSVKYSNSDNSIKFIKCRERNYLLLDSLIIYKDLTSTTFLGSLDRYQKPPKRIKTVEIAVKDIAVFEIFINPDKAWLDKIESAEQSYAEIFKDDDSSGDWQAAGWFHKFLKDKETYNLYQSLILRCLE